MRIAFYILILLSVSLSSFGQRKDKDMEESLKQEGLDDIKALSSEDFPYIERFHKAVREKMAGNLEESKKLYKECLEENSKDDAVYFGLGEIAREQKMNSKALEYFQKAADIDPNNIFYTQELAYIQYEKAEFEEAVENFKKLTDHEPRNVDWLYGYGQVLVYSKKYEEAINAFNKLQDQVGVVPEIMIMKADLYQELKQDDKAEETLLALKKEFPQNIEVLKTVIGFYEERGDQEKAIRLIKELVENEPENGVAQFILAQEFIRNDNREGFLKAMPAIIASPDVQVPEKMQLLKHMYTLPNLDESMVLELSKSLAETHKNSAESLTFRAEVLSQIGQTKEALKFYREAIKNNSSEFRLWTSVLAFESAHRDYQALYEDAQEAITYFPTLPFVYYAAAEGALFTDKPEEAMEFLAAGELYILDDETQKARFAMRKGQIYFYKNKIKEGIEQFNKALNIVPDAHVIKINYALSLANSGKNLSKAQELLSSVEPEQHGANYYYVLALVHWKKENTEEAVSTLQKGIDNLAYAAELYDLLGDIFINNDQPTEATEAWGKALELESRNTLLDKKIKEKTFYAPQYY
jgi:tetratricopeptide (TPR) repeat protein